MRLVWQFAWAKLGEIAGRVICVELSVVLLMQTPTIHVIRYAAARSKWINQNVHQLHVYDNLEHSTYTV